jgi:hypothetical protein
VRVAEQLRTATQTVKSSAAVRQVSAQARRHGPSLLRQLYSLVVLLLIVALLLASWNWAQNRDDVRDRLWGELAFFGLVIALGIAVVSALVALLTQRLPERLARLLEIDPVPAYQALVWGLITVVAIPIAMMQRPRGFVILILTSFAFAVSFWLLARRYSLMPNLALCWSVLCGTILLVGYTAFFFSGPVKDFSLPPAEAAVPEAETLAWRFRPLLFFDRDEPLQPIDIGDANVEGCTTGLSAPECDPLGPSDSLRDYAYIKVSGNKRRLGQPPGGPESAYYYHALQRGSNVYLDYWWFLEHNPSPFGRSILCGQALRWLGEACAEHVGDWEGITIVLVPCEQAAPHGTECADFEQDRYRIGEVLYAQHEKVVAYSWTVLQAAWSKPEYAEWRMDAGNRPLVFSALDSHASYALPCAVKCKQIVHPRFSERRNGRLPWTDNDSAGCGSDCLQALPTENGQPSAWNAFPGPWGPQACILFGSYCDIQPAPEAPAFQKRFKEPECVPKRCLRRDKFVETAKG